MDNIKYFPPNNARLLTHQNCLGLDPDLFFPPFEDELSGADGCLINLPARQENYEREEADRITRARNVCKGCADKEDCLEEALTRGYRGIWGGTTEAERQAMIGAVASEESKASHPSRRSIGAEIIAIDSLKRNL